MSEICEYCYYNIPIINNKNMMVEVCAIYTSDKLLKVHTREDTHSSVKINYCPMCGRKLGE